MRQRRRRHDEYRDAGRYGPEPTFDAAKYSGQPRELCALKKNARQPRGEIHMSPKIQNVLPVSLLSPLPVREILSSLPVRERMKVRVRIQRAFSRAIRDSASCL